MGILPVTVQVEGANCIGQHVEHAKHPCGDVSLWSRPDTAELHNDGNEIEQSGNGGIEQLREKPVNREVDGTFKVEEVDEAPNGGCDKGCHHHKQEPVSALGPRWCGAGHADNANEQFHQFDDPWTSLEIF